MVWCDWCILMILLWFLLVMWWRWCWFSSKLACGRTTSPSSPPVSIHLYLLHNPSCSVSIHPSAAAAVDAFFPRLQAVSVTRSVCLSVCLLLFHSHPPLSFTLRGSVCFSLPQSYPHISLSFSLSHTHVNKQTKNETVLFIHNQKLSMNPPNFTPLQFLLFLILFHDTRLKK